MIKLKTTFLIVIGFMLISANSSYAQEKKEVFLEGVIMDEYNMNVPYAAVGIPKKYVGTASNDEGGFQLSLAKSNLQDSLEISSIGYKTYKIKVQDYLDQKEKSIVLKEDIVSLSEVKLLNPSAYVKNAVKKVKSNTLSSKHQLNMIYRRSSVEDGKTRFMVEHYLKILDYGPTVPSFDEMEIAEQRKSADYRFVNKKQPVHTVIVMAQIDPIRQGFSLKDYNWSKTGDTSYDGEDIVIIEGRKKDKKMDFIRLYIGIDTYGIYKMELSRLNSLFLYKKDINGKLVLSYHNRNPSIQGTISEQKRKLLKLKTTKVKCAYRHEAIVLSVISDRKKFDIKNINSKRSDMGDFDIKYNPTFWDTINLPPETAFYKKSVNDLESIYGVPIETQFNAVNK
ncbi:carboxypeptidase-like regulatory domain-containing protein [Algibacter miyuki]|uniref:Carboxypeptidase-like regulatory domain-containing protein n=1 Tax=Algibacter miyuki TaxID=1306933 RepID=A0ABV5H4G9_9FLAO|nr:carboxypeptidase-like regulatory domain-containing protein [Algibacter miyuki]MDN3664017.1 carboxypeptidase-like regulatory domain-containing protein [Algibacter miyuki]